METRKKTDLKIGFIGQGWIGKNYANDFEQRGYDVTRYALEAPYVGNKEKIKDCEIVFIAVPTPTTEKGFDYSIVESALKIIGSGKIAVVKSTILPGTTEILQKKFPDIYVMHSPEFLREITAAYDAANPGRNIVGIPNMNTEYQEKAQLVMDILAKAKFNTILHSKEAELVKYIGNCFFYEKVVFFNQMYDLTNSLGLNYEKIREVVIKDERIGESHTVIAHASGHAQDHLGRGAGGDCFMKDFEAMIELYSNQLPQDTFGIEIFKKVKEKNYKLLVDSKKDLDLLEKITGDISKYER